LLNSKIFQTINIPEKIKGLSQIQKYMSNLRYSLDLLDQSRFKKKTNLFHPSRSVLIKNIKNENENNNSNRYEENRESKSNNKMISNSRLYGDRLSQLKEKNKKLLNKILKNKKKNKDNLTNSSNEKIEKSRDNNIFVTSFDTSKVKEKNENSSRIIITELNETNKKIVSRNYKYSLPKIESKSVRDNIMLSQNSRNRNKTHIIKPNISFNIKRQKNKFLTKEEKDYVNTIDNNNPINIFNKSKEKEDINKLNKKLISLFGYDFRQSKPSNPEISNIIKGIKNLKNNVNKKYSEYELDKWIMNSKMKYAKWKFGINELEKYFMDVEEFGIKERNELEIRKTFYKKLNLLIDDIKDEQEMKRIKEREKDYGINIKKEDKKLIRDNEYWIDEKALNKMSEQNHFLKMAKQRKIREQRNRDIIDYILLKCRQSANNINNS
jgi:hypothetical protein